MPVGIQAGVDPFGVAGAEQIPDKFGLQHRFPTGSRDTAAGCFHKVAVTLDILHQLFDGHHLAAIQIPGVAVMAVFTAHQAALHEYDKTDPGSIDGSTGFNGMDLAIYCHGVSPILVGSQVQST